MKKAFIALALCLASTQAYSTTIHFDDLPVWTSPANNYGGVNWSGFTTMDATVYPTSGYRNGLVSSKNVAFVYRDGNVWSPTTFTFNSVYLTSAWHEGASIVIKGSLAGNTLYTRDLILNTTAPTLVSLDWTGIDKVQFSSRGGTPNTAYNGGGEFLAFDNVTVNEATGGAVPEPGSLALLGLGAAAIVSLRRRKAS